MTEASKTNRSKDIVLLQKKTEEKANERSTKMYSHFYVGS